MFKSGDLTAMYGRALHKFFSVFDICCLPLSFVIRVLYHAICHAVALWHRQVDKIQVLFYRNDRDCNTES